MNHCFELTLAEIASLGYRFAMTSACHCEAVVCAVAVSDTEIASLGYRFAMTSLNP